MPSLNVDLDYFEHPKTRRLVGLLGRGAAELPIRLWCYCGKYHTRDGALPGYSSPEIESIIGWWGDPGVAVSSLVKVGFLDEKNGEFFIHDWRDHEGHIFTYHVRAKAANRAKLKRLIRTATSGAKRGGQADPVQGSTEQNRTEQEKRYTPPPFDTVWCAYPNRQGKKNALRHYLATVKSPEDFSSLTAALKNYLGSGNVAAGFVKHGSTWFNEWKDWVNPTEIMMKGNANGQRKNTGGNPNSQAARAGFKHGPEQIQRLENVQATLDERDRERRERSGPG